MPQLIAVDLTSQGARLLRAATRGSQWTLQEAAEFEAQDGELSAHVCSTLRHWKAHKATVLLLLPRSDCELRTLSLPAVPDEDLPEMVRFQALQQFASIGDDWPLDYVKLSSQDSSFLVLAATLPAQHLERKRAEFQSCGFQVKGAFLRPAVTAVQVDRCGRDLSACRLIVDRMDDRAELTVVDQTRVFVSRSVLIARSTEDPNGLQSLVTEIRRTLAACKSQFPDLRVSQLVITGADEPARHVAADLQQELDLPATSCDPFAGCSLDPAWQPPAASPHGTFAAAVGALWEEVQASGHRFDFQRPRRVPAPVSRQPFWTAMALCAAAVLLVSAAVLWHSLSQADREILNLRRRISETDQLVEAAQRQMREVESIEEWFERSPNWLVELSDLAERMPGPDRLRLQQLQADRLADGGGRITMKGYVDEPLTVAELEVTLRDERHSLVGLDRDFVGSDPRYPWYFMEEMRIQTAALETSEDQAVPRQPTGATVPPAADDTAEQMESAGDALQPPPGGDAPDGAITSANEDAVDNRREVAP